MHSKHQKNKSKHSLEYRINGGGGGGGLKWCDTTIIGGLEQSGGGHLEKLKIVIFLAKHICKCFFSTWQKSVLLFNKFLDAIGVAKQVLAI